MNQHCNYNIIREDKIIADAKYCVPQYQKVEKVELAPKEKSQPSAEINKIFK